MLIPILLGLLGALVLLIVVAGLVGRNLPERYGAHATIDLERSPEEVWAALVDVEKHPLGGSQVKSVTPLPDVDGRPSWRENMQGTALTIVATEWDAPRRLACHAVDAKVPITVDASFTLEPLGSGTRLVAVNRSVIKAGTWHVPYFRVAMKLFNGAQTHLKGHIKRLDVGADVGAIQWGAWE